MAKTLIIDNEVHREFKAACLQVGLTMAEATTRALSLWIVATAPFNAKGLAKAMRQVFSDQELREFIALLVEKID